MQKIPLQSKEKDAKLILARRETITHTFLAIFSGTVSELDKNWPNVFQVIIHACSKRRQCSSNSLFWGFL